MIKETAEKSKFITSNFNTFKVHTLADIYSFFYVEISDSVDFYDGIVDYFLDNSRLLKYAENKSNLQFEPTMINYAVLFKHLEYYIDDFNLERSIGNLEEEVLKIIAEEYSIQEAPHGGLKVRLDKMGKIGEYLFCNILSEYFTFNCIIPKVQLTSDPNMNVYGIDTLFYSKDDDLIMFGESKLSVSITNGIGLINKSLKDYKKQIMDEFNLMLSSRFLKNNMGLFGDLYGQYTEISLNLVDFIKRANIKKIGIPIFIAHGSDTLISDIIDKLSRIEKVQFFELETRYYFISLPIVDKSKFIATFTRKIVEKREYCENEHTKSSVSS